MDHCNALHHKRNSEARLSSPCGSACMCLCVDSTGIHLSSVAFAGLIHSNWCEQCPLNRSLTLSGRVLSGSLMLQITFAMVQPHMCVCVCVC